MVNSPEEPTAADVDATRHEAVAAMFKSFDKVLKGCRLYQGKGRLVDQLMDELEQRSEAMLRHGEVTVKVTSFGLVYDGKPLDPEDKRKPYLFQLFCDAVRELTIQKGITREEYFQFIDVLTTDLRSGEEDLVTLLWQRELEHVHLYVADTFSSVITSSQDGPLTLTAGKRSRINPDAEQEEALPLSPDDVRVLKPGEALLWLEDARTYCEPSPQCTKQVQSVRNAFQSMRDYGKFFAVAMKSAKKGSKEGEESKASPLVVGQWEALLARSNAEALAEMLRLTGVAVERAGQAGRALHRALTGPEQMKKLATTYEAHFETLTEPLGTVIKEAEDGMLALLSELPPGDAQNALQEILTEAGVDLTPFYSQRLASDDEELLLNTIGMLQRIGTEKAIQALAKTLSSSLTSVRRASLEAMVGKYNDAARIGLGRSLKDPSKDNRLLALRILRESGEPRVAWAIISTLEESTFEQREKKEQEAFYKALASFQDDRTLDHFNELLSKKNLLRNRSIVNRQLMAATALAEIRSEHSKKLLLNVRKRWYLPGKVKKAIDGAIGRSG